MSTGLSDQQVLHRRWQHHRMHIRCGLSPHQAWRVASYLQMGQQLIERGHGSDVGMQLRMLHTLLSSAGDPMLPAPWRHLCLREAQAPMARLRSELSLHDPLTWQAVECLHQQTCRRMPGGADTKD